MQNSGEMIKEVKQKLLVKRYKFFRGSGVTSPIAIGRTKILFF